MSSPTTTNWLSVPPAHAQGAYLSIPFVCLSVCLYVRADLVFSRKWHRPNRFGQLFFKNCELIVNHETKKIQEKLCYIGGGKGAGPTDLVNYSHPCPPGPPHGPGPTDLVNYSWKFCSPCLMFLQPTHSKCMVRKTLDLGVKGGKIFRVPPEKVYHN
jgi:hypothetical protein